MILCKGGGCTAKLGQRVLGRVLSALPAFEDDNLLVGFDSGDDASVYRLTDDIAMIQTLDFFPPMVNDPYLFGQIAAANAVSDVYAMGGTVKTAQNIVCFPEKEDLNVLGKIMAGGADKIREAGGVLSGGHSINDADVKYGLAVTGIVDPRKIYRNNTPQAGDCLVLTKPLGVGIIMAAHSVGEADENAVKAAAASMARLNKTASAIMRDFDVHACTDVTGFGFIGHLTEMLGGCFGADIDTKGIPVFEESLKCADNFLITAAGQRNRNFAGGRVDFADSVPFAWQEVLFDPQTSGGLLMSVSERDCEALLPELKASGIDCGIAGTVTEQSDMMIRVK